MKKEESYKYIIATLSILLMAFLYASLPGEITGSYVGTNKPATGLETIFIVFMLVVVIAFIAYSIRGTPRKKIKL